MDMSSIWDNLKSNMGEQLPGLLMTLVILVVGIYLAKVLRNLFVRVFKKSSMNKKISTVSSGTDIADLVGSLIYYIVLLNVLLVVLERMHIRAVLDPLKNLIDQFLGVVPNLIGAGIVFYAGWIVATIVKSFVGVIAVAVDEWVAKTKFKISFKLSKFLGLFAFTLVFLPIAIQGFDILNFDAVSVPAKDLLSQFFFVISRLALTSVIIIATYYIGKFVVELGGELLEGISANELPRKIGLGSMWPPKVTFIDALKSIAMFFIMLTAVTTSIEILQIDMLTQMFGEILVFGGNILVGGVILLIGTALGNLAYEKISLSPDSKFVAGIARIAIFGLVLSMGLKEMGLADNIVNMAFGLTLGAVAIAIAISFGIGGIDAAKVITLGWSKKFKK